MALVYIIMQTREEGFFFQVACAEHEVLLLQAHASMN